MSDNPSYLSRVIDSIKKDKPSTLYYKVMSRIWTRKISRITDNSTLDGNLSQSMFSKTTFSILASPQNLDSRVLNDFITSVRMQNYEYWELILAIDYKLLDVKAKRAINSYCIIDERIKVIDTSTISNLADKRNLAVRAATGDYYILINHDSLLVQTAFQEFALSINYTHADVIYTDENFIDDNNKQVRISLKPDWSPDLFYCQPYFDNSFAVRKSIISNIGGYLDTDSSVIDYELFLRILEHTDRIYHIPRMLISSRIDFKNKFDCSFYNEALGILNSHFERVYDYKVWASVALDGMSFDVRYDTMANSPLVSIVIPMKDHAALSDACIKSILAKSRYQNYEILLLNNRSILKETEEWLNGISKIDQRIRVLDADFEFNWSKINNFGIKNASGEVCILLNNDTVIISDDWIERLCENALRPEIGVVGSLLLYDDDTIQHAGVVVGMNGWADHVYREEPLRYVDSSFITPLVTRNVTAVTGACMVVSKETITKIDCFDEGFIICGSDVEFCVRAHNNGYFNLYLPQVKLYHFESKSRDSYIPEIDFEMSAKAYREFVLYGDPFYNLNFEIQSTTPTLASESLTVTEIYHHYLEKLGKIDYSTFSAGYLVSEINNAIARKPDFPNEDVRINLLIPSLRHDETFGGISTAVSFFLLLCERSGYQSRIIVTDSNYYATHSLKIEGYKEVKSTSDSKLIKQIVDISSLKADSVPVRKNDVFIATIWWTAISAERFINWQMQEYCITPNPLIYLIQDFEPGFYPWSSRYMLADNTYRSNVDKIAVFNSGLLKDYFLKNEYSFKHEFYFNPHLNITLAESLKEHNGNISKKKKVIIYGRPTTQRNAFEIAVMCLVEWVNKQDRIDEWELISVGEKHDDIKLSNKVWLRSLGKLTLKEYADLMLESYMGISLMVSPHPSYPPLEMSSFGVKTITNTYANKDLTNFNSNIISVQNCSPSVVSDILLNLADLFSDNQIDSVNLDSDYITGDENFTEIVDNIIDLIERL